MYAEFVLMPQLVFGKAHDSAFAIENDLNWRHWIPESPSAFAPSMLNDFDVHGRRYKNWIHEA